MTTPLRVAFARIAQETNSLSPVLTTLDDFRRCHWFEGEALLEVCQAGVAEVPGFAKNLELSGFVQELAGRAGRSVELVPLLSAWSIPGGPLSEECFTTLLDKLKTALQGAGHIDGVMISLHGAMGAVGRSDTEADFLEAIRAVVGPAVPVVATLDLHGQLTSRKMAAVTALCGYHTNPHRDHARTGRRAARILLDVLRGNTRPTSAWRSLPLILGGGTTIDFLPTMSPIFRRLKAIKKMPGVIDASLFMCHLWNDSPDMGWAPVVITDGDQVLADRLCEELAERCWEVRHKQPPVFPDAQTAIAQARSSWLVRRLGTVCICDASDIVGAGAAGENTRLLSALLEHGVGMLALVPLRDAEAVASLQGTEPGTAISLLVGGRLDPTRNQPLRVEGRLLRHSDSVAFGRIVVLDLGDVKLVITEAAPLAMKPSFYTAVGLSPWRADVVVVKSMFPFRLYFLAHSRKAIYARTGGVTDLDAGLAMTFNDPVHPKDLVEDWRPADRRRRGLLSES